MCEHNLAQSMTTHEHVRIAFIVPEYLLITQVTQTKATTLSKLQLHYSMGAYYLHNDCPASHKHNTTHRTEQLLATTHHVFLPTN